MKAIEVSQFASRKGADVLRPQMSGVYHDGGFMVASDTYVLVAVRKDYPEGLEGRVIGRDGQEITGKRYPRWREVFPDGRRWPYASREQAVAIDSARVREVARRERLEHRVAYVKAGDAFFRADVMAKACKFLDAYGLEGLTVTGPGTPAYAVAQDGSRVAVMPAMAGRAWNEEREDHIWYEA
jgi:hypothetical protein